MAEFTAYEPDALFRCRRGHGTFRRDRMPTHRGSLYCMRCGIGLFPDLDFIGREGGQTKEPTR